MNSFFGLLETDVAELNSTTLPAPREIELDLDTLEIVIRNGEVSIVEGLQAIKIWIYKCLMTQRFRYDAYTWDYGHELESLIGSGLTREAMTSEATRMIKEALSINPYILDVKNISISFVENKMVVSFIAVTNYGEVSVNV